MEMLWSAGRRDVAVGSLCGGVQRGSVVSGATKMLRNAVFITRSGVERVFCQPLYLKWN